MNKERGSQDGLPRFYFWRWRDTLREIEVANTLVAILIGSVIGVLLVLARSAIMSMPGKRLKQKASITPNTSPQKAGAKPAAGFAKKHRLLLRFILLAAVAGGMVGCIVGIALTNPVVGKAAFIGGAILGGIGLLLTFFVAALISLDVGCPLWEAFLLYSWISLPDTFLSDG